MEAEHDRPGVGVPLGGLLARQGRDDGAYRHAVQPVVRRGIRDQEACAAEHDGAPAGLDSLSPRRTAQGEASAAPHRQRQLPAPAARAVDLCRRLRGDAGRALSGLMRVYIPATLAMLQQLVSEGSLWPVNGTAFAVTPTLREAYAEGDDDELAEVALREAALASLRLLAADEDTGLPPRRAVLAAEVDLDESGAKYRPDLDDAVVRLGAPVTI